MPPEYLLSIVLYEAKGPFDIRQHVVGNVSAGVVGDSVVAGDALST